MGHLLAVRSRQRATDELFEPLKETIMLLESYDQKLPEQVYAQLEVSARETGNSFIRGLTLQSCQHEARCRQCFHGTGEEPEDRRDDFFRP